ncbi:phage recombination protein Bet [Burkholderia anthina]|uniref:phage recombination protein Bet n=1 Tax=Burkholderia anthina TaxID=179879 RepID=UPI001AA05887|nr:phage recombination protein Bet [Burkholderia anthina]QTD88797.1 phage recombination protein Bet [Burkholderia anthina]
MNAPLSKKEAAAVSVIPALAMDETELIDVLRNSFYPGASDGSIKMVIGYCRASNLDPMQKPVHIVPMSVKRAGTNDQYEWRDVVMPGIGLYRVQAARTNEHAGTSEPEFGPMVDLELAGQKIRVPEWCKVTVFRLKGGKAFAYVAIEYWVENYATAGRNTAAPNAMWKKRPRGQLAKCAEAQALRKAFPEVGTQPTAEEMEGKTHFDYDLDGTTPAAANTDIQMPGARPALTHQPGDVIEMPMTKARDTVPAEPAAAAEQHSHAANAQAAEKPAKPEAPRAVAKPISESVARILRTKLEVNGKNEVDMKAKFGFGMEGVTSANFNDVQAWAEGRA